MGARSALVEGEIRKVPKGVREQAKYVVWRDSAPSKQPNFLRALKLRSGSSVLRYRQQRLF
jgi:hypothetical protein